jgi:hypothetical protein
LMEGSVKETPGRDRGSSRKVQHEHPHRVRGEFRTKHKARRGRSVLLVAANDVRECLAC